MKHQIESGMPTGDGQYVCYLDNEALPAFTERKILMWFRGEWCYPMSDQKYRGRVHGWIGPLPVMKVEDFACKHETTRTVQTGDGVDVTTCFDCGEQIHIGKMPFPEMEFDL